MTYPVSSNSNPPPGGPDYDIPKPKDPPVEARMPLPPTDSVDWPLVTALAQPFHNADRYDLVHKAPSGKYGEYVKHSDVNQRLLSEVGFFDFEIVTIVRGAAPPTGEKGSNGLHKYPGRENAIVGVTARLTITDKNQRLHSVTETGTVDNPAMHHDGESLKNATSDAFKRCAMRFGLGLHLWCSYDDRAKGQKVSSYFLDLQLEHDHGKDQP
jgi:hypothetical protein